MARKYEIRQFDGMFQAYVNGQPVGIASRDRKYAAEQIKVCKGMARRASPNYREATVASTPFDAWLRRR